jgi:hypothetical protein
MPMLRRCSAGLRSAPATSISGSIATVGVTRRNASSVVRRELDVAAAGKQLDSGVRVIHGWKPATCVCFVATVLLGLSGGCAYQARQRASGWFMVETRHVQLRTNIRREGAVRLAREMQRTYDVLARYALPCAPKGDDDIVQVTVLPVLEFKQYAPYGAGGLYFKANGTWLAGYEGQIVLPDDLAPESKQRLQHEMTHRLVTNCFIGVPAWLNEGLAGFFETMLVESGQVTFGRPPYVITSNPGTRRPWNVLVNEQRVWIVPMNTLPSIESMVTLAGSWRTHDMAETIPRYATAWALVHFLMLGAPDLAPRFEAYLAGLRTARGNRRVLFAKSFEDVPLQDRLNAYVRRGEFDMLQSRPSAVEAREIPSPRVRAMDEEEAHLHLAWLDARSRDQQRRERFRVHLAAAKQNPRTRNAAILVAADALYGRNDLVGADREVQDGLRSEPDNASFLEAHLDILLARNAPVAELKMAAERLRPRATTGGAFCSLAMVANRTGDRKAALELSERGLQLSPRLPTCRLEGTAEAAPP